MKTQRYGLRRFPLNMFSVACFCLTVAGCGGDNDNPSGTPAANNPPANRIAKTTVLMGAQESTPVATEATGYASFVVDSATLAISGDVSFTGFTATMAHIHTGAPGTNGAPVVTLTVDNNNHRATVPQSTVLTQTQFDDLLAGNLYVNIHSTANPGGEIRGQIGRVVVMANLSGTQEVPAVTTTATGVALFAVDPATLNLSGRITYTGITATAAHIHTGATGVNGTPAVTLTVAADSSTVPNDVKLTPTQFDDLLAGRLYVNVHSTAHTGGEIRGQLGPVAMAATLEGTQESPTPVTTAASGRGAVVVDPDTLAISGGIVFSGVTATAAHIHTGAVGTSGSVLITLVMGSDGVSATVPAGTVLTSTQYDDLVAENLYFNVHSAANPSGEIRGQINSQ